MLDTSRDIVVVMLVTLVALVLALLGLQDGVVLLLLGVPLALVFPGYAVIAWWAQGAFTRPTRLVLSVGLSVGLTTIVSWILAWTPWGLQIWTGTLVLGSITLGAAAAALRRRTVVFVYATLHPPTLRHPLVLAAGTGFVLAMMGAAHITPMERLGTASLPPQPAAVPMALRDALGSATPAVALVPEPVAPPPAATSTPLPATDTDARVARRMNIALGNWPTRHTATANQRYTDGQYHVALTGQPSIGVSSRLPTETYRLSIEIALEQGAAGLVFLAGEPAVFYRIMFDADRGYAIQRLQPAADETALAAEWIPSAAVQARPLRVEIERRSDTLQFFVNDEALTTFTVPDGTVTNQVGVALADASGYAQATFSNLVVEHIGDAP